VAAKASDTPTAPLAANSGKTHVTKDGESYASIAAGFGVAEQDLRQLNDDAALRKGLILKIPAGKAVSVAAPVATAVDPALASEAVAPAAASDDGMVEAVPVDVSVAPKAKAIVENESAMPAVKETAKASGKTHQVKKGETIVKIAKQYKVTQDALMSANSITDPTKLKAGANLVIP
jgi:LysM repeat protein